MRDMIEFIEMMPWWAHVIVSFGLMTIGVVVKELQHYDEYQDSKYAEEGAWWADRKDNVLKNMLAGIGLTIATAIPFSMLGYGDYFFLAALMTGYAGAAILDKLKKKGEDKIDAI